MIVCILGLVIVALIYGLISAIRSGFSSHDLMYLSSATILSVTLSHRLYRITRPDYDNSAEDKETKLILFGLLGGLLLGYILIKVTLEFM